MSHLEQIKNKLIILKPELLSRYPIETMGLFGSVVRDDFTDESDIIVTFSARVGMEFIELANELEEKLKRKVDLVSKNGIKDKYLRVIDPPIIYV